MAGITLITPAYVKAINQTLVSPVGSLVVKPNELFSALARPMHVARYEPERNSFFLAATLAYDLIQGTSGHQRGIRLRMVANAQHFFVAREYLRLLRRCPGVEKEVLVPSIIEAWVNVAKGNGQVGELAAFFGGNDYSIARPTDPNDRRKCQLLAFHRRQQPITDDEELRAVYLLQ
ncbi:hypothetical protein FRC19_003393 [Serendipita sp. 401]|nr:hypothetical protein FRC19_003393 [Serendipita sp. 401]KAG9052120.1 hypothetical protein FS842_010455 [Serendipita sp. 407]